jgi:hypothetical protein
LYPQNGQGGEMILPFLYHKNWLDATTEADLISMGTIDFQSLTTLYNANGLTTDTINIKVYAWAEDLEVAGPTVKLALQAGKDEYGKGVVSRPASAIARAAGKLKSLPIIGPFATATSYAAGAVADIASLFGYTNVPVIDDVHAFRTKPYPNMAATDIGTPVEKLTLDAKNELSIDGKICGADVDDELTISSFCKRESFLFASTWTSADAADTGLFHFRVSPVTTSNVAITGGHARYATPMSHLSECFRYWRGDINIKLKFICSAYHRGRVRINWDPKGDIGTSGDYTTQTYTKVVDITEETEVMITIPYTQTSSYLTLPIGVNNTFAKTSTTVFGIGDNYNGIFTVRVLNEQTSPVSSADIIMLVFVSGADNLEFACPMNILATNSPYEPQSGIQFDVETPEYDIGLKPSVPDPNINLVYMGEHCVSLRQLMRRSSTYKRYGCPTLVVEDAIMTARAKYGRSPEYPGYDLTGNDVAVGITSAVSEPYNWVSWNYMTWFSQCFVGSRGAYNYAVNPLNPANVASIMVTREILTRTGTIVEVGTNIPYSGYNGFTKKFVDTEYQSIGMTGLSLVNDKTQCGSMVSVPMYSRYKFLSNNVLTRTVGDVEDDSDKDTFVITTVSPLTIENNNRNYLDIYCAAGTDFSLVFFLNVPTLYRYSQVPTAV